MQRRGFLKAMAAAPAAAAPQAATSRFARTDLTYPRQFKGKQLAMIAFPLGGIGAGSIGLGGRGQLRDWEIFNRPDKGLQPAYAFASLRVDRGKAKPLVRVLESAILPPFEGATGLGSNNAPGLPRFRSATFHGEYPTARIDFHDGRIPVLVSLDAFTPFIPLDPDLSGMPLAILRYQVANAGRNAVKVALAYSLDNPVGLGGSREQLDKRENQPAEGPGWRGLRMTNPGLAATDVLHGEFALGMWQPAGEVRAWRGWPKGRWWNSPMLFWDSLIREGTLGEEPQERNFVGTLACEQEIAAGGTATYTFLLAWHFPNRTPARCGWKAPKGDGDAVIGNWYARRWANPQALLDDVAARLPELEKRTRGFVEEVRASNIPAPVKDAAMANLSTLVTQTCFRTADGEFHGFEGSNDKAGCCYGNCTHVWNYETATAHLFPTLARSLRKAAFGYSQDEAGAQHFRQVLPDGKERSDIAAADGQMGQVMKVYLDWRLSGDKAWLTEMWPRTRKALEFAWVKGGWDADRDGVLEGVQHNTYDVEFYGPNPQCGIYYLGALRAAEEMAREVGDPAAAAEYRGLFEQGSRWVDANLFNGEYYVQKVRGVRRDFVAATLISTMGSDNTEKPEFQVGDGCLVDQLVGQYQADVCGLGPLLQPANIRKTLESIYRYNYKRELSDHESVQRIFAVNDESALVICDYGKGTRPRIPFPYYAEVMTGFEYATAAQMIWAGMEAQGIECIANIRRRYDGERRNPWNEAECGHHYARAMAAWSGILALTGFRYHGGQERITVQPKPGITRCIWSCATAWGVFTVSPASLDIEVREGELAVQSVETAPRQWSTARLGSKRLPAEGNGKGLLTLNSALRLVPGERLRLA